MTATDISATAYVTSAMGSDIDGSTDIVAHFTGLIRAGELPAGAEMPSIRGLAGDLGVAPGTVRRAYGELESQGLIVTSPGRPSRVAEREQAPCEVLAAVQVLVSAARRQGVESQRGAGCDWCDVGFARAGIVEDL